MAIDPSDSAVWDHWVETEPLNPPTSGLVAVNPTVILVELLNECDQELEVPTMIVFVDALYRSVARFNIAVEGVDEGGDAK